MAIVDKAQDFDIAEQARRHLLPNFTRGRAWNSDDLGVIDRGEGCYVYDTEGVEYLDGLAGLFCTNLGHGRKDLAAAGAAQLEKLAFYPTWGWANEPAARAAAMIAERAPGDLSQVFFVSSGSEAVESMLKLARCSTPWSAGSPAGSTGPRSSIMAWVSEWSAVPGAP